jgi:phenylacetate-CoA ligase
MTVHYDALETRHPSERQIAQFERLRDAVRRIGGRDPRLAGLDPDTLRDTTDLARIPVLRKDALKDRQHAAPPFGDADPRAMGAVGRLFMSPGPVFEPEGRQDDPWGTARAFHAAGFRPGDIVLNTFAYHLTPGGFILDGGARALGCPVIPAGPGNKEAQLDLIAHYRPAGYAGTPDFLKIILDAARDAGRDVACLTKALVSGAALPGSLRAELEGRGVAVRQCYATADAGLIAYETSAPDGTLVAGMIADERILLEIVRPGTDEPVAPGEVGEVVITKPDAVYPLIRFGTGDLSALIPEPAPCGRTHVRIRGWLGRADQRTKVKGMFVDPAQIAELRKRHPEIARARLIVTRAGEQDEMTLRAEASAAPDGFADAVSASLAAITKLKGRIELVAPGSLPNDGKVVADERPIG